MRSLFAALRTIVLPFGATTGRRIIIDGVNGTITVFDANNQPVVTISSQFTNPGRIDLSTGDDDETLDASIAALLIGTEGSTERSLLELSGPSHSANARGRLRLTSGSTDDTIPPSFEIRNDNLTQTLRLAMIDGAATAHPMGVATLVAGTVTVNHALVTASTRIFLTSQVDGGTPGFLRVSARVAGTSFTITSSNAADTSTVAWLLIEPI